MTTTIEKRRRTPSTMKARFWDLASQAHDLAKRLGTLSEFESGILTLLEISENPPAEDDERAQADYYAAQAKLAEADKFIAWRSALGDEQARRALAEALELAIGDRG